MVPAGDQRPEDDERARRFADMSAERERPLPGEPKAADNEAEEGPGAALDMATSLLDAFTALLILEVVSLPLLWLFGGDLYMIMVYALLFTAPPFVILLIFVPWLERRERRAPASGTKREARK